MVTIDPGPESDVQRRQRLVSTGASNALWAYWGGNATPMEVVEALEVMFATTPGAIEQFGLEHRHANMLSDRRCRAVTSQRCVKDAGHDGLHRGDVTSRKTEWTEA